MDTQIKRPELIPVLAASLIGAYALFDEEVITVACAMAEQVYGRATVLNAFSSMRAAYAQWQQDPSVPPQMPGDSLTAAIAALVLLTSAESKPPEPLYSMMMALFTQAVMLELGQTLEEFNQPLNVILKAVLREKDETIH